MYVDSVQDRSFTTGTGVHPVSSQGRSGSQPPGGCMLQGSRSEDRVGSGVPWAGQ